MLGRVRPARLEDADALALVARATFLETYAGIVPAADIVAHCATKCAAALFLDWLGRDDHHVTIAEHAVGDAPIGFTVLSPPDLPVALRPGDIELRRIYVLATAHGIGLGHALMNRAVDDARAMNGARLLLGVHGGNTRAHRFYERQGFTVAGTRRFLVGTSWFDDLVYARDI
ncbi:MAG TPA: GNAT family N-acetyltransferase [Sphingomonas sp.]|nr:GNAT family N-acetyltransferase [Sphingomonas sp.]